MIVEFRLLGPVEAVRTGGEPVRLDGQKARQLLAMLMLHANQVVSVDRLADALWGEQPPVSARQTIQYFVHKLRRALGGATGDGKVLVETHANGYLLRVAPGALDQDRFEAALRRARPAQADGDLHAAAEALTAALAEWRGPALADVATDAFAQPAIARLEEQRLAAVEELTEMRLALGQHADLISDLEALSRSQPLRERVHRLLMVALYRSGRQVEALAVYRRFRDRLVEELGLEPGAELRRLEAQLLAQDPTLGAPSRPAPTAVPAGQAAAPPAGSPAPAAPAPRLADDLAPGDAPSPSRAALEPIEDGQEDGQQDRYEERRTITALVAGISLRETVLNADDLEDSIDRRGRALEPLLETVGRYGGTVVTVFGGTVLAVFGVPRAREDDPERAVRAALAIRQAAPEGVTIRVGVDTGEAIVAPRLGWGGTTGDRLMAVAGGVTGAVLDVAAGLQAAASPGVVLVGQAAHRATARRFVYEQEGTAWRPARPRSRIGTVVDEPDAERPAPLVERHHELVLLAGVLDRARRGRAPQLVTVVGAPGIGKTRLVAELGRQAEADPELITWRQGRSLPYGQRDDADDAGGVVYWALAEIVRAHTGIAETDSAEEARAKLDAAVADVLPDPSEAAPVAGQLRRLLHLGAAGEPAEPAGEQRQAAFAAWVRFLEAVAEERPLALVIEDLHWADEALLAFIDQLVDQAGPVPLLVVCTARPELLSRRPGWGGGKPNAIMVSLTPLSAVGSAELLDALLAADGTTLDQPTRAALLAKAGGNPLFLEEYVRVLRHRGPGPAELPVPETVQQLITARIDALPDTDRRLLQDLAVVGTPSWTGPLAALGSLAPDELHAGLGRLARQELLRRARGDTTEPTYVFRHPTIREVAYNQLLRADRADRHRQVAAWLERHGDDRADLVELLAHHYLRTITLRHADGQPTSDLATRARPVFVRAGDQAAALGAWRTAAHHYQQALAVWPELDAARREILARYARTLVYGEHGGEAELTQALEAFAAAGDRDRIAAIYAEFAQLAEIRGDAASAHGYWARARAAQPALTPATALAYASHAVDLLLADQPTEATKAAREVLTLAVHLKVPTAEGIARSVIGGSMLQLGELGGEAEMQRAITLLDAARHPTAGLVRFGLAWWLWWAGELDRCAAACAEGRHAAAAANTLTGHWFDVVHAGVDYAAGRWDTVVALVDALVAGSTAEHGFVLPWCYTLRGRVRLGRGDVGGAQADARAALELAAHVPGRRQPHAAAALHARTLLAAGDRDQAAARVAALLDELRADQTAGQVTPDLAAALVDLGATPAALPAGLVPTRWHAAVAAEAGGELDQAAKLYDALGSSMDAASARLRLAGWHATRGEQDAARAALAAAVAAWQPAGADGYLRQAQALAARLDAG